MGEKRPRRSDNAANPAADLGLLFAGDTGSVELYSGTRIESRHCMMPTKLIAALICAAFLPAASGTQPRSRPRTARPMRLTATAYCDQGTTKSGAQTTRGTVAADPRLLPVGTVVRIEAAESQYSGTYTVKDTGAKIKGRKIDIFMPSCATARTFGKRVVRVTVLRRGTGDPTS